MTSTLAPELIGVRVSESTSVALAESVGCSQGDPDSDARRILTAAVEILRQGEELLGVLSDEDYTRRLPASFNGTMGGHLRHCLDHFTSLLRGLDSDLVDYDHRERDPRIERDPAFALGILRRLRMELGRMDPGALATPVFARCEVSYDHGDSPVTRSSLGRELVYAVAHGIHHYAIISVMARLMGSELPPHFGIAPSTVAYRRSVPGTECTAP
ncbi:MAG: hypothetical protein JNL10_15210 [Verrucomicrobiales bacterium]|nr:hypothetical protein [Verrucomicrobiales bacterium]